MTGYAWTIVPLLIAANVVAAAVLLPLQFRWRDTNRVRWMLGAYLCVLPAALFLPWTVAFRIQQAVSGRVAESAFSLSLDTAKPVTFSSLDERLPPGLRGHASSVMVTVPIAASPEPANETWRVDHVRLRAIGPGMDQSISSWNRFPLADAYIDPAERLAFNMPMDIFRAARERHAEIQVTVYLTSFRQVVRRAVASLDGESIDGFSICRRGADPYKTMVLYQCGRKYEPWPLPQPRKPLHRRSIRQCHSKSDPGRGGEHVRRSLARGVAGRRNGR